MCLAVPGRIVKIEKDMAIVDYGSERRPGKLIADGFAVDDYVIIQGGIVIEKVPRKEAEDALALYRQATG
ncbi:MAG: HypC/HybG/HupF family hydrogenase formation chaperone [DPANN group archaeon]|nr:HypC/HybG/HupF family hydrogenase formation chaperone [DPANN group archaeon]